MHKQCPQCHGVSTLEGKVYNQVDYVNPPAFFRPSNFPFYAIFSTNVEMENSFWACSSCGFMWSKVDSQQLQRFAVKSEAF